MTAPASVEAILARLESLGDAASLAGMARFGITPARAYGVRMPGLRQLGKEIGRNHDLAVALWAIEVRETRILASLIASPEQTGDDLMEAWVQAFDYWEICDQVVMNLFRRTRLAVVKAHQWSARDELYVKRAGFVMMAQLAAGRGRADAPVLRGFLPAIAREASDSREMVKKAVNWALRQIGKHSLVLNQEARALAQTLVQREDATARWVGRDALRELESEAVTGRLLGRAESH